MLILNPASIGWIVALDGKMDKSALPKRKMGKSAPHVRLDIQIL